MSHVLKIAQYTEDQPEDQGFDPQVRIIAAEALMFFYDDCHKIYLVTNQAGLQQMLEHGWDKSELRHPCELAFVWECTCSLRFVSDADLTTQYVPQGAEEWGPVTLSWEEAENSL